MQIVDVGDGRMERGRLYHWGTVEVENESHCDLPKLRRMLLRTHLHELRETTEVVL